MVLGSFKPKLNLPYRPARGLCMRIVDQGDAVERAISLQCWITRGQLIWIDVPALSLFVYGKRDS